MPPKGPSYYAVRVGREPGIYNTWAETEAQVKGYPGAIHKKFNKKEDAEQFMVEPDANVIAYEKAMNDFIDSK